MENKVFNSVAAEVANFSGTCAKKREAAESRLQQLQKNLEDAEKAADAAIQADDQTAWVKANKAMAEAGVGIKYINERLAAIRAGSQLPLGDFIRLRDQIEAEQGRFELAFIAKVQEHMHSIQDELMEMQEAVSAGKAVARELYAIGGVPGEGYSVIQDNQPHWPSIFSGFDCFLSINLSDMGSLNSGEPIDRMVRHAMNAVKRVEVKGGE